MARRTRTTGIGQQKGKELRTAQFFHNIKDISTVSNFQSNGTAVIDWPVGNYVYFGFGLSLVSSVAIADVTTEIGGQHVVNTADWPSYVSKVSLEVGGQIVREYDAASFLAENQYRGFDATNGFLWMQFGGPKQFLNDFYEDAFMLGTRNVRQVRLLLDLTGGFPTGSMHIEPLAEYAATARDCSYLRTHKTYRYNATAQGEYSITNLPIHSGIAAVHFLSDQINGLGLEIDGEEVYDVTKLQMLGINGLYPRDYKAHGEGITCDFLRQDDPRKGVAALTREAQRKRGAGIRATLDMAGAGEIVVVVEHMDPFNPN